MLLVQISFGSYRKLLPSVVYERNSASVNPDSLRIETLVKTFLVDSSMVTWRSSLIVVIALFDQKRDKSMSSYKLINRIPNLENFCLFLSLFQTKCC